MLNSEIITLIKAHRFSEAAVRVRSEKTRLNNVSLAHPIFDLLDEYQMSSADGYSHGYWNTTEEDRSALQVDMLDLLSAFVDAGMDKVMDIGHRRELSPNDEIRSRTGMGHSGEQNSSYEVSGVSLYARFSGLGWIAAMEKLREAGYEPSPKNISSAVTHAVRRQKGASLDFLINTHSDVGVLDLFDSDNVMSRLMRWPDVSPRAVAHLFDAYDTPRARSWIKEANNGRADDKTAIEWISLRPGQWNKIHQDLLKSNEETKLAPSPGLWTTLFRQYVQTGKFKELLHEALHDGSFSDWKDLAPYNGDTLISWLAQGGALSPPAPRVPDYMGVMPPETPASLMLKAQLRRNVELVRQLSQLGCQLSTGDVSENTESMGWAKVGWVPSRAFAHRHPEFLLPSSIGNTPIHVAASVDVALAWEKLGVSAQKNHQGADPWVVSMQESEAPAPWGKEIAQRLKQGLVELDAVGNGAQPLSSIATKSPPLARFWLKRSKTPPPKEMVEGALDNSQWGLLREWIEDGYADKNPELRVPLLDNMTSPPSLYRASPTAQKAWGDMAAALDSRPGPTWPEKVQSWRNFWSGPRFSWSQREEGPLKTGAEVIGRWGDSARDHWAEDDWLVLPGIVSSTSEWANYIPFVPTLDEAAALFWRVLLDEDEHVNVTKRYSSAHKIWQAFDCSLPISQAGPEAFRKLAQLDESQTMGSFADTYMDFKAFLKAEELSALTLSCGPPAVRKSGPRL